MKERHIDPSELEAFVLQRARSGLAPNAAERRAALGGIAAGLSLPPPPLPGGVESLGASTSSAGTSASAAGAAASGATQLAGGAVKLGAVAGGLSLKATVAGIATATAIGVGCLVASLGATHRAAPSQPATVAATVPPFNAEGSNADDALAPQRRAALRDERSLAAAPDERPGVRASAPQARERRASPSARDPQRRLPERELAALRDAQSALRRGDAARALRLMRRLDQTDPQGVLSAERAVTRVLALCQLGRTRAATAAAKRALRDDQTTALYRQRLATSCAKVGARE